MKTTFSLSQGTYSHRIELTINENTQHTTGQVLGQLARKFYLTLATMRLLGNGKGIDLRQPFDIVIETEGVKLLNTHEISEEIKARITCGLTKRGQNRFARLLAVSLWDVGNNGKGYSLLTDNVYCDLMDENNTAEMDEIMRQTRVLLDEPFTHIYDYTKD